MTNVTPSDEQAAALAAIRAWYRDARAPQEFYLAGYAGTGKTTLAGVLIAELGVRAVTATYTGKAAHVLRRKGVSARTIHSLIYEPVPGSEPVEFRLAQESDLGEADLLVLDEVSMVSDDVADDLRSFGKKMLVMGDPGQLPPIRGAGAFTRRRPDHFLKEIHRQAAGSAILRVATAARLGEPLEPAAGAGAAIRRANLEDVLRPDYQVICGVHRVRWDVTRKIRQSRGIDADLPTEGERLLCCRNRREAGLFNGAIGTAASDASVTHTARHVRFRVRMEDEAASQPILACLVPFREHREGPLTPAPYDRDVDLFDFGYVLTCHKAQGSEWPNVVVIDDSGSFRADRARWLYTAITRASDDLILLRR